MRALFEEVRFWVSPPPPAPAYVRVVCDRWPWKIPLPPSNPPLILPTLERFLALKWLTVGRGFLFCLGVRPLGLTGIRSAWCPLLGTSILATSACETGRYGLWCDVRRGAFVERMHYHSTTADPICLLPLVALSLQEHTYTCTHARRDEDSSFY